MVERRTTPTPDELISSLATPGQTVGDVEEALTLITDPVDMRNWFAAYVNVVGKTNSPRHARSIALNNMNILFRDQGQDQDRVLQDSWGQALGVDFSKIS